MKKYKTLSALVKAIKDGEIPGDVVSPGAAANLLGISRTAFHQRMHISGSLEAFQAEDVILVSVRSIEKCLLKKRGIPETQGELNVTVE